MGKVERSLESWRKKVEESAKTVGLTIKSTVAGSQTAPANDDRKKLAAFAAAFDSTNLQVKKGLDKQIAYSWLGDATRKQEQTRDSERQNIERDFGTQQGELQKKRDAGEMSQSLFDQQTADLDKSLQERLKLQDNYYQQEDEMRNNGAAGFVSGLATQLEASTDLYSSMQNIGKTAFTNLSEMVFQWAETGKMNVESFATTFIQSMGAALLQYATAQVAMAALSAFTSMIGVPYAGPTLASAAAIAAAAGAGALLLGVSTALKGQAHDGIDSVPETGTWLLQKGERVTTARTSAKLDATLDRISSQATGGQAANITIPLAIHGDPDRRTLALIESAVMRGARLGYQMTTSDLAGGTGQASKALNSGWTVGRKKG